MNFKKRKNMNLSDKIKVDKSKKTQIYFFDIKIKNVKMGRLYTEEQEKILLDYLRICFKIQKPNSI